MIRLRALDSSRNLIGTIPYINLQWTRKYYTSGQFVIQIAAKDYDEATAYIYTPDRPELGVVQQVTMTASATGDYIEMAGFFIEAILNDKIIYPMYSAAGRTETIARALFTRYKDDLPITLGTNHGLGTTRRLQETGAFLGDKIYTVLQTDELSYRLIYDYIEDAFTFDVWQGLDRTSGQDVNPHVVFSRRLGNVNELTYTNDNSNFKNYAVVAGEGEGTRRTYTMVDLSGGGYKRMLFVDARDLRSDDLTAAEYIETLQQRGVEKLLGYGIINDFSLDINPQKKGRQYLIDFDLGDKCDVNIDLPSVSIRYSVRVTEIAEIIKNNTWSVTLTVGDKMPTDIEVAKR